MLQPVHTFSRGTARSAVTQTNRVDTFVAPVSGINSRVPLASSSPTDAVYANNFFVRPQGLELRAGSAIWQNNFPNPIGTLMPFVGAAAAGDKLFGVTYTGIYDVTARTENVSPPTPVLTHAAPAEGKSEYWSHTNFATSGTNYLVCCSPGNGYWTYDPSGGWVQRVQGTGAGQINGTDPTQFTFVMEWKQRLWFFKENDSVAWYLPAQQIAGTVTSFDFGPLLSHGGYLAALISWTRDGGDGIDDYLVICGTEGDVAIYQGSDPDQVATFSHTGSWYLGRFPIGGRFFEKVGSDVYCLCAYGLASIELLTRGKTVDESTSLSYKVEEYLAIELTNRDRDKNWEVKYFPAEETVLVKVPAREGEDSWVFAVGLHSAGWSTLRGLAFNTLGEFNNQLYGSNSSGEVYLLFYGNADNVKFDGIPVYPIEGEVQSASIPVADPGRNKIPQLVSPSLQAISAPTVRLKVYTEFQYEELLGGPLIPDSDPDPEAGPIGWDNEKWNEATWSGSGSIPGPGLGGGVTSSVRLYEAWRGAGGLGHYLSLRMNVRGPAKTLFTHWRLISEVGGVM